MPARPVHFSTTDIGPPTAASLRRIESILHTPQSTYHGNPGNVTDAEFTVDGVGILSFIQVAVPMDSSLDNRDSFEQSKVMANVAVD